MPTSSETTLFDAERISCFVVAVNSCWPSGCPQGSSYPAKYCSKTSLPWPATTTEVTEVARCPSRAAMPQSCAPSMPTLSGDAVNQPSSVDDGGSQARFRCPGTMPSACTEVVETVNASMRLAPRMPRRGKRSSIILLPAVAILRRWRHRDLHGGPLQHFLVERVELRIGLAPAAIGEAEVGIAEHADEADLRDVERAVQHLGHVLEARHSGPGPVPMVVRPRLPLQALRPHHLLVAAQQHGIEHAVDQGMIGLGLPAARTVVRDQAAAGHLVEIFDDDVRVQNNVAVIGDQDR